MSDSTSTIRTIRRALQPPAEFASREVGSFFVQLEDQSARLRERLADITPAELEWQPAPGMNTIGMLLAHLAVVEVYWIDVGVLNETTDRFQEILGIDGHDDGLPLPEGAAPPEVLAGKPFSWFQDLETKARAHSKQALRSIDDAALDEQRETIVSGGTLRIQHNRRWTLYHVLEHYAGHFGQILMLRHQYRDRA